MMNHCVADGQRLWFFNSLVLRRAFLNPAPEKVSNQNASVPAAARVLSLIAACDTRVKQLSSSSCYSLS